MSWVLVFILMTAQQPSFLSPYPDREACEAARAAMVEGAKKAVRSAFCVPLGGVKR